MFSRDGFTVSSGYGTGDGDSAINSGALSEHESDNLWYVDLETKSILRNYCFDKGEIVWYADLDKYILFNAGEMITYDAETQEEVSRHDAEWFDKDSGYQYEVVLCQWKSI